MCCSSSAAHIRGAHTVTFAHASERQIVEIGGRDKNPAPGEISSKPSQNKAGRGGSIKRFTVSLVVAVAYCSPERSSSCRDMNTFSRGER